MSLPLLLGCFWLFAATICAFMPMRHPYIPGVFLLIAAPILLGWIAWEHGLWIFAFGMFAFLSMFRNPLRYLWKRARGERPEIPT